MEFKKILFFTFFLLIFNNVLAQYRSISGVVSDSLSSPLEFTNIIAQPVNENLNKSYTLTDEKGKFQLLLHENENYFIEVSYLGYESTFLIIDSLFKNIENNIILRQKQIELEEVIVNYQLPVVCKNDTLIYRVEAFADGTERKLKEVLKKLPGVEVEKNGTVSVHGKKVDIFLLEKDVFFGGGSKLAIDNIPADAVNTIEVIDHFSATSVLSEVSESEKLAINITLKKEKKQFVFGDIDAGSGLNNSYIAHSNLFFYSPKTKFNFIGDLNNVGEKMLTIIDYINFEGGIGKLATDPSSFFKHSNQEILSFLEPQDFLQSDNKFGGLSFNKKFNSKLSADGYAILSKTNNFQKEKANNEYLNDSLSFTEKRITDSSTDATFGLMKFALNYLPKKNIDISYNVLSKNFINNKNIINESEYSDQSNTLKSDSHTKAIQLKQNFEWHQKHSKKFTTSFVINHLFKSDNSFNDWKSESKDFLNFIFILEEDDLFHLEQLKRTEYHQVDVLFKNYFILDKNNHLYFTIANNFLNQHFSTTEGQKLTSDQILNFSENGFGNDLNFYFNDLNLDIKYKLKKGIATYKLGCTLHYYDWKIKQSEVTEKQKIVVSPDFKINIKFSNYEKLKFNYKITNRFADAPSLSDRLFIRNFNSVFLGNPTLENQLSHNSSIRYFKSILFNDFDLNVFINYNKKVKNIRNEIILIGINQLVHPSMTYTPESKWSFNFNLRKGIKNLDFKWKSKLDYASYNQTINLNVLNTRKVSSFFGLTLETNFKNIPNIEIGHDKEFNSILYKEFSPVRRYNFNNSYASVTYPCLNGLRFSFDYTKTNFKNDSGGSSNFNLFDFSLIYQKDQSQFGLEIKAKNLFNVQYRRGTTISETIISDYQSAVLPRILLLKLNYEL